MVGRLVDHVMEGKIQVNGLLWSKNSPGTHRFEGRIELDNDLRGEASCGAMGSQALDRRAQRVHLLHVPLSQDRDEGTAMPVDLHLTLVCKGREGVAHRTAADRHGCGNLRLAQVCARRQHSGGDLRTQVREHVVA